MKLFTLILVFFPSIVFAQTTSERLESVMRVGWQIYDAKYVTTSKLYRCWLRRKTSTGKYEYSRHDATTWDGAIKKAVDALAPIQPPNPTPEPEPEPEPPPIPVPPSAESPTGYAPRLIWTADRQGVWKRMVAENHPYWLQIKGVADRTGTNNEPYSDLGMWAVLAYQFTGNAAYGQKALDKLRAYYPTNHGFTNFGREFWIDLVLLYEWTSPLHTQADRDGFVGMVNRWATDEVLYWSPADSDQGIGAAYFGVMLSMQITKAYNPRAQEFIDKIGGLDASSNWQARGTPRDALRSYIEHWRGGVSGELTEYGQGTLKLLFSGVEALRTIQPGAIPELGSLPLEAARTAALELVPGFMDGLHLGDTELPRNPHARHRTSLLGLLGGITGDAATNGLYDRLVTQYGPWTTTEAVPGWRAFYTFNPYAAKSSTLPLTWFSPGQGVLYWHDNWTDSGKALVIHTRPKQPYIHHEWQSFGDFQYWSSGWAITHPQGYGMAATVANAMNMTAVGGLSGMGEIREILSHSEGPFPYTVSRTGGKYDPNQTYAPPPVYLREHRRTVVLVPGATDVIVVRDAVDADDPKVLQTEAQIRNSYGTFEADQIMSSPSLVTSYFHAHTQPVVNGNSATWTAANGQTVRIDGTVAPVVEDLKVTWLNSWAFVDSEKRFRVRFGYPSGTYYHTIQIGPSQPVTSVPNGVKAGTATITFDGDGKPTVQ